MARSRLSLMANVGIVRMRTMANKRIVFAAVQHGQGIRWRGFSTMRILGFRVGYGDGPLTQESQDWMKEWFRSHGIGKDVLLGL
jgi:hypothetical protein